MDPFKIDVQTLYDLNIFAENDNSESLFRMLNFTSTPGGKDKLKHAFRKPSKDINEIIGIQHAVTFLSHNEAYQKLPVNKEVIDYLEVYFYNKKEPLASEKRFGSFLETFFMRFKGWGKVKKLMEGVTYTIQFLNIINTYIESLENLENSNLLQSIITDIKEALSTKEFNSFIGKNVKELKSFELLSYDKKFRDTKKDQLGLIFDKIYELDKLISITKANKKYNLCTPEFLDTHNKIEIDDFYHLFLEEPVKNSIHYTDKNLMFLTGPNMAGKTTLLKSVGVIICMAHAGMGVPAKVCKIPLFNGIFSSVNTTDNLFKGYSYFYTEVMRVKNAAEFLHETDGKAFLIFDELFKGTNVKDAFDCSYTVIEGLVKWKESFVILSSHLLELGTKIEMYSNVLYNHFESEVIDGKPKFSFKLAEGLSDERLGLLILQNEKISELLEPPKK